MNDNNKYDILWPGWETVRLIGRGSFGTVYEIQRTIFEETEKSALKVISIPQNKSDIDELYSDGYDEESISQTLKTHLKSIVSEYSLMKKMNGHSNVVSCEDIQYIQHNDGMGWDIFIKMELLTPLVSSLTPEISEDTVIQVAKDIASALVLCKKHNIIHRDIKPQNIFISDNGDYKLGDFGIAKTVEKTMGGTKIGTYKYMAPEVYNNQPYGPASDIYSLGLVLYWMLNERRMPFMPLPPEKIKAGIEEAARHRRFSGEPIPAPKSGSERLKDIVLKACAFDPNDRYESADEMLNALNALSFSSLTHPESVTPSRAAPKEEDPAPGDDMTAGPAFDTAPKNLSEDEDATMGPVFSSKEKASIPEDTDEDATVGPVFTPKSEPAQTARPVPPTTSKKAAADIDISNVFADKFPKKSDKKFKIDQLDMVIITSIAIIIFVAIFVTHYVKINSNTNFPNSSGDSGHRQEQTHTDDKEFDSGKDPADAVLKDMVVAIEEKENFSEKVSEILYKSDDYHETISLTYGIVDINAYDLLSDYVITMPSDYSHTLAILKFEDGMTDEDFEEVKSVVTVAYIKARSVALQMYMPTEYENVKWALQNPDKVWRQYGDNMLVLAITVDEEPEDVWTAIDNYLSAN